MLYGTFSFIGETDLGFVTSGCYACELSIHFDISSKMNLTSPIGSF